MDIQEKLPFARHVFGLHKTDACRGILLRLLFFVIMAGFIDTLLLCAGASMRGLALFVPLFCVAIMTLAGEVLFSLFRIRTLAAPLAAAFVAGSALSSVALMIPPLLWQWTAWPAFLLLSVFVLFMAGFTGRYFNHVVPAFMQDIGAAFIFVVFVGFFARHQILALPTLLDTATLPAWTDYYIHGATIDSFADSFISRSGDIMLPGMPRVFYHYATFVLTAALGQGSGLPGLGLATAILLPFGLLIGLFGLYVFARQYVSYWPAIMAVVAVASIPDPLIYFFGNGFFDFHWLLFTAPGSAYAIGLAAVAYICLGQWFSTRRFSALILAALLTLTLILIRVHMFFLIAPAFAGAVVLNILPPPWRGRFTILAAIVFSGATFLLAQGLIFSNYASQYAQPFTYIFDILRFGPEPYARVTHWMIDTWGNAAAAVPATLIILFVTLGLWGILFSVVFVCLYRENKLEALDAVPPLLCCTYLFLIFWAPMAQNGSLDEYKHRHFLLLYAVIVVWTLLRFMKLDMLAPWFSGRNGIRAIGIGTVGLVALLVAGQKIDPAKPGDRIEWANTYFYNIKVDPGIVAAAYFIRSHARQGDIIAVDRASAYVDLDGPANKLASIADMPIYVGRAALEAKRGPQFDKIVQARLTDIDDVMRASSVADAFHMLQVKKISWLVTIAPAFPAWDAEGNATTFRSGQVYVYRLPTS